MSIVFWITMGRQRLNRNPMLNSASKDEFWLIFIPCHLFLSQPDLQFQIQCILTQLITKWGPSCGTGLKANHKGVVTFITFVTLLLPRVYPATLVVTASHKVHICLKLSFMTFLSQQALYLLLILWKPDNLEEAS